MTRDELKTRTQQAIDAIRVFKDKDYGWSEMEKMLYEILIELDDSDWQTGTPTEEGDYLVAVEHFPFEGIQYEINRYLSEPYNDFIYATNGKIVAWQRIEPFEEEADETDIVD